MIGTRLDPDEISVSVGVLYEETLNRCDGIELVIGADKRNRRKR
jgi:hypothetical protein